MCLEKEGERAKPDSVAEERAKPATGSEERRSEITYFFKTRKGQKAHLYRSCHTIVNSRESDVEKTLVCLHCLKAHGQEPKSKND